mgnify:FL=1
MSKNASSLNMKMVAMIMVFYMFLSYVAGPMIAYHLVGKNADSIGTGLVIGSILSILMWYKYGIYMVEK